jgi:soluble cytochrome b562
VKDDFGITGVRLNYQVGGREHFINLKNASQRRSIGPEIFKWDLGSLNLNPGERVLFRLEMWDNDSISGPKKGYSQTLTLLVRDERARAAREGEEARQIADSLLDLLADQLEDKKDKNRLTGEIEEILKRVDKNLERMEKKEERFDFEALKRNLTSLKDRLPQEPKETITQEMERLALLAEEISKKAKMNEVEAMAREIKNRQNRFMDFLKEFKGPLGREDLASIMKELKALGELIRSIMEALTQLTPKLPEEFMNAPELQGFDFQDLLKDLEEIQKKLMAGDIQGALEAAQRLFQALSEMMALLGRVGAQAGQGSLERLHGEMTHQAGELEKILTEQKAILNETERMNRELTWEIEKEMEKKFDRSLSRLNEILERLRHSPTEEQKDLVEELETLLKAGNLERFSRLAGGLEKAFAEKPDDQKQIKELMELMRSITPHPNEVMTPEQRQKFPELAKREEDLRGRTNTLREKLEMFSQIFPGMDMEILKNLKEAIGDMGEASGKLRKEDAPSAIPPEQEAIKRLTRSQQAMQQLAQQMAQQMAMRMQANRWGYQWWGYDPRPGWYYGPWVPMPTRPQPEFNRPLERGYTGIDREEFQLPSKDAYQVPKIFREKIMESLKEGIPPQYKREVEKYFRGLTE